MRSVIQRVSCASITIGGQRTSGIQNGLLILLGIEETDTSEDVEWLAGKIVRLRLFNDEAGVMNRSIQESGGELAVLSRFTLFPHAAKSNGPPYNRADRGGDGV